jgi:hypothetical protein
MKQKQKQAEKTRAVALGSSSRTYPVHIRVERRELPVFVDPEYICRACKKQARR